MTKKELVAAVAQSTVCLEMEARLAVEAVLEEITAELTRGGRVSLHKFGTFETKERPARQGRNPQTGEAVDIPAGRRIRFRPARALKEAVQ